MRILSILARPLPDRPHAGDLGFLAKGEPIGAVRTPPAPAPNTRGATPAGAVPGNSCEPARQAA